MDIDITILIKKAIKNSIEVFESGVDINEAVKQSALKFDLNMETIRRVVEGINNVHQLQVIKKAEDKLSGFPLADSKIIIQDLHQVEKNKTDLEKEAQVDDLYNDFDIPDYNKNIYERELIKHASPLLLSHPEEPRYVNKDKTVKDYFIQKKSLDEKAEDYLMKSIVLKDKMANKLVKVANYFSNYLNNEKFSEFEEQVRAAIGNRGDYLLDCVVKHASSELDRSSKTANFIKEAYQKNSVFVDFLDLIVDSFKYKEAVKRASFLKDSVSIIDSEIIKRFKKDKKKISFLDKIAVVGRTPEEKEAIKDKEKRSEKGKKGRAVAYKFVREKGKKLVDVGKQIYSPLKGRGLGDVSAKISGKGVGLLAPQIPSLLLNQGLKSKKQKAQLDKTKKFVYNLRYKSILEKMFEDEILQDHDPKAIIDLYNQMIELTPRLARNQGLATSTVRNTLESGLSGLPVFESLIDMEKKLVQIENEGKKG